MANMRRRTGGAADEPGVDASAGLKHTSSAAARPALHDVHGAYSDPESPHVSPSKSLTELAHAALHEVGSASVDRLVWLDRFREVHLLIAVTVLAAVARFYRISQPGAVVFDGTCS